MTVEECNYLLSLPKYLIFNRSVKEELVINLSYPIDLNYKLNTPDDQNQQLIITIWESDKRHFKATLHHHNGRTNEGLIRIDYKGRHVNPAEVIDSLPDIYRPLAGKTLMADEAHIHYVVDGYKPLAWALPIEMTDYPIKKLVSREDYASTIEHFFRLINVRTKVVFNNQLSL